MSTATRDAKPLVGLPADTFEDRGFIFHSIGDKYLRAVAEVAGCVPIMIPALDADLELAGLLDGRGGGGRLRPDHSPGAGGGARARGAAGPRGRGGDDGGGVECASATLRGGG